MTTTTDGRGQAPGPLEAAVRQFLAAERWAAQEIAAEGCLLLEFGGESGRWRCVVCAREEQGQVVFYSYAPVDVPEERFPAVVELINRANFGLFVGNFELQMLDGTLQFRTSIDVQGDEQRLTPRMIRHLVYQNVLAMDRYLPAIRAVVEHGAAPAEAIAAVEG